MKILVVRFRQMGDAILSTCVFNTIKRTFPEAETWFVLNERIAPLFEGHPSIDHIITFTEEERHNVRQYLNKVWRVVHSVHFDVIIDLRSTVNTMVFSLFSPRTAYRIGLKKGYTCLAFNHLIKQSKSSNVITYDLNFLKPLNEIRKVKFDRRFTLKSTESELDYFRQRMVDAGIDFSRPVVIAGVTAKLPEKTWNEDNMVKVVGHFVERYPDVQVIFNYAPGREEENARRICGKINKRGCIFLDIQARSPRELLAMASLSDFYFGNEGGARHIMHACGKPSFVICSPKADKYYWLPQDDVPSYGISVRDILPEEALAGMTSEQKYAAITSDIVEEKLFDMCDKYFIKR